ncbi:MAG: hypothetical protein AB7O65_05690 [Candidatus Korobacteraceae bacterium]
MSAATSPIGLTAAAPEMKYTARPKRRLVNRELLLILGVFVISAVLDMAFSTQRMVLGLYLFPTIFSAYHYGRRHAVLTASFSIFLVVLLSWLNPSFFHDRLELLTAWFDIAAWSGLLLVTAYTVGTL